MWGAVEDIPGSSMFSSMAPAPDSNRAEALKALSAEEANFIMYGYPASVLGGGPEHANASFWPGRSSAQRKQAVCYGFGVGTVVCRVKVERVALWRCECEMAAS
jgi:hypothetical protein